MPQNKSINSRLAYPWRLNLTEHAGSTSEGNRVAPGTPGGVTSVDPHNTIRPRQALGYATPLEFLQPHNKSKRTIQKCHESCGRAQRVDESRVRGIQCSSQEPRFRRDLLRGSRTDEFAAGALDCDPRL